ncbi:alpha/beta hydrolase [Postechiella marina]|uniref:Alpha/beta hydrolase n=1 Tax=Postechiella marina TaxID=943941 RepID=A0ABP8C4E1_9FLAO
MILKYKGINIFYTDQGKGNAVVLLHGFLENSSMWNAITPELTKRNRVICIDLLGHGQTECLGYVHSMELMASVVEFVLKHLKIRRSTCIGHSMGGYVALAFAEKNPDALKGLVLINSTAVADTEEKKKNRDRAITAVKNNHKSFIRMAIANLLRPKNRKLFAEEKKATIKEALKTPLQGIVAALEGMKIREDREVLLHFTPYKKMMIIGKKDPVLDYNSLIEQTKNTEVKCVEFPDGHMSHIENRTELTTELVYFIEKK